MFVLFVIDLRVRRGFQYCRTLIIGLGFLESINYRRNVLVNVKRWIVYKELYMIVFLAYYLWPLCFYLVYVWDLNFLSVRSNPPKKYVFYIMSLTIDTFFTRVKFTFGFFFTSNCVKSWIPFIRISSTVVSIQNFLLIPNSPVSSTLTLTSFREVWLPSRPRQVTT